MFPQRKKALLTFHPASLPFSGFSHPVYRIYSPLSIQKMDFFSIHKQTEWLQKKSAVAIRTKIRQPSKKSALKGSRFGFVRGRFLCMIGRKGYFATRPILSVSEDFRYCSLADSWEPPLQGHSARKCAERATHLGWPARRRRRLRTRPPTCWPCRRRPRSKTAA